MKKLFICLSVLFSINAVAQDSTAVNKASFELGSGLNFSFNHAKYNFKISGMVQPAVSFDKLESNDADYILNSRRTYLNFGGNAVDEKVSFFLQMDFSKSNPLLDAWIAWQPVNDFKVTFGQMQTFANNREMMVMENYLQFPDRGLLSTSYSRTGREMGLFLEYGLSFGTIKVKPRVAVTSGDGINSFGVDSRDVDLGGLKYAGRLDIYPLGEFKPGNDNLIADIMHEDKLKMVIGGAASYNDGASEAVGEGHGDFVLYDGKGASQQPDYRQVYGDILLKYHGFSFLGEYVVATATSLEGTYTSTAVTDALLPTQISEYLALGTGYNAQLGYVCKAGYGLDFRYGGTKPEFENNLGSVISETNAWTVGLSKYCKGNALKVQAAVTSTDYSDDSNRIAGTLLVQLVF